MCGRYSVDARARQVGDHFDVPEVDDPDIVVGRFNVAPSQPVPAVRPAAAWHGDSKPTAVGGWGHGRELVALKWGLIPRWSVEPRVKFSNINARDDHVETSRVYKDAYLKRRCLLPATGFYEWAVLDTGKKQPYHFRLKGGDLFAFAGIWERWAPEGEEPIESCALITTMPNAVVAPVHDRMPAIVRVEDYAAWLDPGTTPDRLRLLLGPYPADELEGWPVSPYVSSPHNQGERCIRPVT